MIIDFDYLSSISRTVPFKGTMFGCSFDGQRLALVGYSLVNTGEFEPIERGSNQLKAVQAPKIFFATYLEQITITRAMRVFDQIGGCLGTSSLALVVRGTNGRNDVFLRHLRAHGSGHSAKLFTEGQGRHYEALEVLGAVADDRAEGVITLAPEFQPRPERVLLDEEIALVDPSKPFSPLQEAFIYGLGEWSCKRKRPKYKIGQANLRLW